MTVLVRCEQRADEEEISEVVEAAFGRRSVADFTLALRESPGYVPELAFVAEEDGAILGFTMLSYVRVEGRAESLLILTPMAVRPDRQGEGIGGALVRSALAAADARAEPLVLVEGVPDYYPRFGFRSASARGLEAASDRIPDAAWMVLPLGAYDPAIRGRVIYPSFFPEPRDA